MSKITQEEFQKLFPYCIPEQWRIQMLLFGKDDWSLIPEDLRDTLTKIFDTDFPWELTPMKGYRKMWIRSEFTTNSEEVEE